MFKIEKLYARDLIGIIIVLAGMFLIYSGINSLVAGLVIMVVTWYFARRIDGEGEPKRDLHERVKKVEEKIGQRVTRIHPPLIPGKSS